MPANYILQDLIQYPIEVSVFYYRFPNRQQGNITGFIKKEFMQVKGDGESTLRQLIVDHPVARFRLDEMRFKHKNVLETVIPKNQIFRLCWAGNLSRGSKLISIKHEKTEGLLKCLII